ncbi:hypothetical protein VN12_25235 [Pirellula sp. SH-Sr6A]|nr:hypothetical protein [Pirellula sp. SH-Sr6A]AMV35419.1 hypothetical protein VN12_25235 [Pirellula sp. SH-Sr6A]
MNTLCENGLVHDQLARRAPCFSTTIITSIDSDDTSTDASQFTIGCTTINANKTNLIQNSVKRSIAVPSIVKVVDGSPLSNFFGEITPR